MVSAAANALATIGTVFWCIQLLPQIYFNYRRKSCEGLPTVMLFLWALCGIPFSIYFCIQEASIPLRIQPQLFTFFCLVTWGQSLYYPPVKIGLKKTLIYCTSFVIIGAGVQAACIIPLIPVYKDGTKWPNLIFGVVASILLAVGLLPPYFELAKRNGQVIGINFIFLFMDSMGALFSFLSLIVGDPTSDILGMILYLVVLALEIGIVTSHIIWMFRFNKYTHDWIFGSISDEEVREKEKLNLESGLNPEMTNATLTNIESSNQVKENKNDSDDLIIETHSDISRTTSPN